MMFGEKQNWKGWKDIRNWCEEQGFENVVKRMDLNNKCWMSSGEFGRSQVEICDNLRFAEDYEHATEIAKAMDEALSKNYGLY